MGRLVDLDTVPHWKITYTTNIRGRDELCETDMVLMRDLENAPPIDAVQVVRCKDCEYYDNNGMCFRNGVFHMLAMDKTDYCSKGERKETDDEIS